LAQAIQARGRLYAALAATWLELVAFMLGRPRSTVGASSGMDVWNYLLNQFVMVVQYLCLTLWPGALVLDYGLPRAVAARDVLPNMALVGSLLLATAVALAGGPWADRGGGLPGRLGDGDDLPKRGVQVAPRAVADGCRAAPERACPRPAGVGIDYGRRPRRGDGSTEGGGARLSGGALCAGYGAFL